MEILYLVRSIAEEEFERKLTNAEGTWTPYLATSKLTIMIPNRPYTLHITRRQNWSDKTNYDRIPLFEWKEYVKSDPHLDLINALEFKFGPEHIIIRDEGLSIWKFHISEGDLVMDVMFSHEDGNIDVVNPDEDTIIKMVRIARRLNAKVRGDNGEVYDESYEQNLPKRHWWKFWK